MVSDRAKQAWDFIKIVIKRKKRKLLFLTSLIAEYISLTSLGLKPEILVGPIPIYNLQAIGHASSDEVLKYRAMGGIFLAHQKGGKKTFRFRAYITGAERFMYYKFLETLQLLGSEHLRSINPKNLVKGADILYADKELKYPKIDQELVRSEADIYSFPYRQDISDQEYAFHKTFPIITPSKIYTNMYLETLRMAEDVKLGKNTIEVDCAFRHFEAPTHFRTSNPEAKQTKIVPSKSKTGKKFGEIEIPPKKKFYSVYTPYNQAKAWRKIENLINLVWINYRIPFEFDKLTQKQRGKYYVDLTNLIVTYTLHNSLKDIKYPSEFPSEV